MRKVFSVLILLLFVLPFALCASGVDTFCYDRLDNTAQLAYEALYYCMTNLAGSWNCGSMPQEAIRQAYECILMDHPEIFWSDGYTYVTSYVNNEISGHRIELEYDRDAKSILAANAELEKALVDIVRKIGRTDKSYETVRALYDHFTENFTYDALNLDQSMYSVMMTGTGVCASFARAFEFILQCLDIPCTVVRGRLSSEYGMPGSTLGHEWNLVFLNGSWYHVDVTSAISMRHETGETDYRFLCATTAEILQTHMIDNVVPLPECSDSSLNFYNYYGLSVESYSREAVASCMLRAMEMGLGPLVKFTNYRALTEAVDDLFTNRGIFQAIKDYTGLAPEHVEYSLDDKALVLRLIV